MVYRDSLPIDYRITEETPRLDKSTKIIKINTREFGVEQNDTSKHKVIVASSFVNNKI